MMKVLQVTICFAAIIVLAAASSATWGYRGAGDIWLSSDNAYAPAAAGRVTKITVQFPGVGRQNNRTITAIYVTDRFTNSSGAYPAITSGGVNYKYATITLTSQTGKGVNSQVDIYGR